MASNERGRCPTAASVIDFLRSWRLLEIVCAVAVLETLEPLISLASEYKQYVPPNNAEGVNGYPVRLGSEWCLEKEFASCEVSPDTLCCHAMEAEIQPGETVSSLELFLIYFGIPFVFIFVRQSLMKCGRWKGSGSFMDAFLGLLFCFVLCFFVTDVIKVLVGRPRPNYFALHALIQYGGTDVYSSLEGTSIRSFPSGHSAKSMAGTLYVTLICWADLSRYPGAHKGWRRSLLAYLSVLPALIAVWVGITRVRDYWHFQDDVLAGWIVGAVSAAAAVRWITFPETFWRGSPSVDEYNLSPETQSSGFALVADATYGNDAYNRSNVEEGQMASA
ncbi:unnamed protein product [Ascophyllum nodosum]